MLNKKKLNESVVNSIKEGLDALQADSLSDFQLFMKGMNYCIIGSGIDTQKRILDIIMQAMIGMFHYKFSENDKTLEIAETIANQLKYDEFQNTVNAQSIEARKRYNETHIRKKFIRSGTRGWPLTIEADETGWCLDYGMGEMHYEERTGKTAKENFMEAYDYAGGNDGGLITEKEWESKKW